MATNPTAAPDGGLAPGEDEDFVNLTKPTNIEPIPLGHEISPPCEHFASLEDFFEDTIFMPWLWPGDGVEAIRADNALSDLPLELAESDGLVGAAALDFQRDDTYFMMDLDPLILDNANQPITCSPANLKKRSRSKSSRESHISTLEGEVARHR